MGGRLRARGTSTIASMDWRRVALLALVSVTVPAALAAGCGGPDGGGGDPTPTPSGTPSATPTLTPTPSPVWSPSTACTPLVPPQLSVLQAQVFNGSCLSTALFTCHAGTTPSAGLSLTSGMTLVETSNMTSVQVPSMVLVAPGSRVNSYLHRKLIDDPIIYTAPGISYPMPNTGEPLSQCAIDAIGEWIDAGAQND